MNDELLLKELMDTFNTFAQQEIGNKLSIFAVSGLAENIMFSVRKFLQARNTSAQTFEAEKSKGE